MQKKYFFSFFLSLSLILSLSLFAFNTTASAAVINSYDIISNNRDIDHSVFVPRVVINSAVTTDDILLGKCTIDGVFYSDFIFNVSYQRSSNGHLLLNFNYKPMYAIYDSDTSVFKISEFSGFTISLYLPQYNSSVDNYTTVYEWVPLTIGGNYGTNYSNLFLTQYKPSVGVKSYNWTSSDYTFHHFTLEWDDVSINETFNGPYSSYNNDERFRYVCQTIDNLLGFDTSIKVKTSVAFDIDYFPDVLSFAEREQLQKLDDVKNAITQADGTLNDIKDILNQTPNVPLKPPPQYDLPDTREDEFITEADKFIDDFNNYKNVVLEQFPTLGDNLFGNSANVIQVFVDGSFDAITYRITDVSSGVDFSPVMTIIYLSFIVGLIAILRG